jgi:16S rRNA (cytosine967-C5)-methyltransferase
MSVSIRFAAAQIIDQVLKGKSLAELLPVQLATVANPKDRALLQMLCFGVCRYSERLQFYLQRLMPKPLKAKDSLITALLWIGLYQLSQMRLPSRCSS